MIFLEYDRCRYTMALCAMGLLVCGCNGAGTALRTPPPSATASIEWSWATPDVPKSLIYVADSSAGTVYMYGDKPLKQVGELTGFSRPVTMCVDPAQDVYIVDLAAQKIYEYAHGATMPIKTLNDRAGHPFGCSINPKTGDLAVSNYSDVSGKEPGNVVVFVHARGPAHKKQIINMSTYYFPTYDSAGDLFVDGIQSFGSPEIAEQPQGTHFWKILRFRFYYKEAFYLQWDGQYLALCDPTTNPNVIYEFSVSDGSGYQKGMTTLKGDSSVFQFWIGKYGGQPRVAAANSAAYGASGPDYSNATAEIYPYPGGGDALFTITGFENPTGIVISNAPKQ